MAPQPRVRVSGFREFMRAAAQTEPDIEKRIKDAFKEAGEPVRRYAAAAFARYDTRSAAGYKVLVRQRGVAVVQSLHKVTGLRPDYGSLQMRKALLPGLYVMLPETEKALEEAFDKVALDFES